MGKGRFFGSIASTVVLVLAVSWWGGCGQSNDQGISFRAIGFFSDDGETGELGRDIALACAESVFVFTGLENNLVQGINVDFLDIQYRLTPGGSLELGPQQNAIAGRLGPSSGQEPANPPRGFFNTPFLNRAQLDFLNQNSSRLPPFPFRIFVEVRGFGTSDSGDLFRTNRIVYNIDVLSEEFCDTGGGSETPGTSPTATPAG